MAFRANEAELNGLKEVENYFISRNIAEDQRERSKQKLFEIINEYGPVIDSYPSWHPLVANHDDQHPETTPGSRCGYKGLDHTRYFRNAFITCPYGDGQEVIDAVNMLPRDFAATIKAEKLDVEFYNSEASPILVYCDWSHSFPAENTIPASVAVPLMLQKELPFWKHSQGAETWETMRYYFLGSPHGSRSSLFIDQETALAMKKIWNLIIQTGMFGPVIQRS